MYRVNSIVIERRFDGGALIVEIRRAPGLGLGVGSKTNSPIRHRFGGGVSIGNTTHGVVFHILRGVGGMERVCGGVLKK